MLNKYFIYAFFCLLMCGSTGTLATEDKAVSTVLDSYHRAAAQADGKTYFSLMAEESVFIGTDATERWSKPAFQAFAEPYFSKGRGWEYVPQERHISFSPDGKVAWFDELLNNEKYGLCRGSGVLVKEGGEWKITQYNLHFPVPNAIAKDVVRMIREHKPE
ncbi:nuclear transport factor 2 family protein [Biformimicrobium ophioploci]|uniref:Nuclear transport factor 2 family protein n=1 Tax=Biformimicrobium ophioploci TaxID=3036711 RepID=A0ABQ6LWT8_9GAMM|nr:nuclear transport factor 2 family protein [Microbulbifer sp. NKW57]GMG86482.1 nuclear transport factor 2 family protein [Microbulbifer sp. NKW57]